MATYYAIHAGGNWNGGTIWSTIATKDATRVGSVSTPTTADTCILDDWSGNVTINASTCVAAVIDCTTNGNYAGTLTFTSGQILGVSGNIRFSTTMTLTGTGTLRANAAGTLTSNGLTFPGALVFNAGVTYTLADNWTVTGTVSTATAPSVLNGNILRCNGDLTLGSGVSISGTTTIRMGGTGTILCGNNNTNISNNLTFNSAGTITLGTNIGISGGTVTYTAGTIINTGSTLFVRGSFTLNTSTMHWGSFNFISGGTVTLSSALILDGTLSISINSAVFSGAFGITTVNMTSSSSCTYSGNVNISGTMTVGGTTVTLGNFNFNVTGNVTINSGFTISGTMTILMSGTGTVNCTTTNGTYALTQPGVIACPFTVNTSGIITFGTVFGISSTTTLTYTAGTLDFTTNNNLLYMGASMNIPTAFAWNGLLFSQAQTSSRTYTMTQDWTFAGDIVVQTPYASFSALAGAFNATCRNLIIYGGNTFNFPASKTLTVTTGLYLGGQNVSAYANSGATLQSGTATTAFSLKYQGTPANNKVYGVTFTDVDASTSTQAIANYNGGTLLRTTNINNVSLPVQTAATFVG